MLLSIPVSFSAPTTLLPDSFIRYFLSSEMNKLVIGALFCLTKSNFADGIKSHFFGQALVTESGSLLPDMADRWNYVGFIYPLLIDFTLTSVNKCHLLLWAWQRPLFNKHLLDCNGLPNVLSIEVTGQFLPDWLLPRNLLWLLFLQQSLEGKHSLYNSTFVQTRGNLCILNYFCMFHTYIFLQ